MKARSVSPDYAAQRAVFQSKLVYTNQNNQEIVITAQVSTKPIIW